MKCIMYNVNDIIHVIHYMTLSCLHQAIGTKKTGSLNYLLSRILVDAIIFW